MKLILDLPEGVIKDLNDEAIRERPANGNHATLLLDVVAALHDAGKANTPSQAVVDSFLRSHAADSEQFASLVDELVRLCVTETPPPAPAWPPKYFEQTYGSLSLDPLNVCH